MAVANAMMQAVALLQLPNPNPLGTIVTISVGITDCTHARSAEEMIRNEDDALYKAKRAGRNRVIVG